MLPISLQMHSSTCRTCSPPAWPARSHSLHSCCPAHLHRAHRRGYASRAQCSSEPGSAEAETKEQVKSQTPLNLNKEFDKFTRGAATTFAPRASGPTKKEALRGSKLYTIFGVQAWVALAIGGLASFNIIFPSEKPDVARLLGMWSIWIFTVPALRARECNQKEKDALNILFLLIPLINVILPIWYKNFGAIWSADVAALAAMYAWKVGLPKAAK